jgi:hypothetical protein
MIDIVLDIIGFWTILVFIAFLFILMRRDAYDTIDDLRYYIIKHDFPYNLLSVVAIYISLPFSIPYSIIHIFKR